MRISRIAVTAAAVGVLGATLAPPPAAGGGLVTAVVDTRNDEINSDADCSLREALRAAWTSTAVSGCPAGPDVIRLTRGRYDLTIDGDDDLAVMGDLDVPAGVTIRGAGMKRTKVDANDLDRVFSLQDDGITLSDLTIQDGLLTGAVGGAGIRNIGTNTLRNVRVRDNNAPDAKGGGIGNVAPLTIVGSEIRNNEAADGGGIVGSAVTGTLTVRRTTVVNNRATQLAAGTGITAIANATIENTTISGNDAASTGGGLVPYGSAQVEVIHSTITDNDTVNIYALNGGDVTLRSTVVAEPRAGSNCDSNSVESSFTDGGGNITDDVTCPGQQVGDAGLRPLGNYGGPIPTHALQPNSPALNFSFESCVATDARGAPRPQALCNTANTNFQDSGAYELVRCAGTIVNRVGTPERDVIRGSGNADGVIALGGNDSVSARGGRDKVCGGNGKDVLQGQGDNDKLLGQQDNDALNGGPGDDTCVGGPGSDSAAASCERKRSL